MIQKIILIVFLFFSFSGEYVFANIKVNQAEKALERAKTQWDNTEITRAQQALDEAKARAESCGTDCIDMETFMIDTSIFSDGGKDIKVEWDSQATINKTLGTIIQKLMIALWVISLWIMSVWAWYIILYHGEDEYLSKWKSIITAGVIALIVSLSSYYMVNLLWYILYKM